MWRRLRFVIADVQNQVFVIVVNHALVIAVAGLNPMKQNLLKDREQNLLKKVLLYQMAHSLSETKNDLENAIKLWGLAKNKSKAKKFIKKRARQLDAMKETTRNMVILWKNYPVKFYETEKDPTKIVGYTAALGLMAAGAIQIVMAGVSAVKGDATKFDMVLGPGVFGLWRSSSIRIFEGFGRYLLR